MIRQARCQQFSFCQIGNPWGPLLYPPPWFHRELPSGTGTISLGTRASGSKHFLVVCPDVLTCQVAEPFPATSYQTPLVRLDDLAKAAAESVDRQALHGLKRLFYGPRKPSPNDIIGPINRYLPNPLMKLLV